jgi:hypothetical protein
MRPLAAHPKRRQSGVVLVVSLVFLLIIMVLTVSMFRDVGLQEIMSGNQRAKVRTQHVANSALREQWAALLDLFPGETATDARSRSFDDIYDQDLDADPLTQEIDMTVQVDICFDGTSIAPGTDTDYSAYLFFLESRAADQSSATTRIRQGGYVVAPNSPTLLAGTCP